MSDWSALVYVYIFAMVATAVISVVCLIAQIIRRGGVEGYYRDRGVRQGFLSAFLASVVMIIFMTWVLSPAATVLCRDVWLLNRD